MTSDSTQRTLTCASCGAPIASEYYQVDGKVVCGSCRARLTRFGSDGAEPARILMAIACGIAAGIAGFALYFGVTFYTGMNLSLLAVLAGWLVGGAVRWASKRRGGPIYQGIAMAITYVVVCGIYIRSFDDFWNSFARAMIEPWRHGASNLIGWAIILFALYEAWSTNRKSRTEASGPFYTR